MQNRLPTKQLVLLGAGHTNAHLIRMWRMQPLVDARLTCVSDFPVATYSGMLPGTLAGQYQPREMEIDLVRLCASTGVRLIVDRVVGVDCDQRRLLFDQRPSLAFDALSIGIGSRPATVDDPAGVTMAIKPMQTFLERLDSRLRQLNVELRGRTWRIAIIGAGAAGFEIACCLSERIGREFPDQQADLQLVDGGDQILDEMAARAKSRAMDELERRGVTVRLGSRVESICAAGALQFDAGDSLDVDLALWATSARPPELLSQIDLPKDESGFLLTRDTLQSTGCDAVFAVGDAGTCEGLRRPKSGVFAVRQGPVLWENMRRHVAGRQLKHWRPQSKFLRLLNTDRGRAILSYRGVHVHAAWCWKLKDWIDRRFMAKYQDYAPMEMASDNSEVGKTTPYCGGCGCKLPAASLSRVLESLDNPPTDHVLVGLAAPEDVAVISSDAGQATAVTTDFFTSFLDDPWLMGKIAALNALSDLYAKAVEPRAAQAIAAAPHGEPAQQEAYLRELLHGALSVLRPAGAPIVGGHTIEAAQPIIGFTLLGAAVPKPLPRKSGLKPGDQLILTKPLGTGVLLAAHMRALCQADWMETLLATMLTSNREAAAVAKELGVAAMTDVTGFGLAGHMLEMLGASHCSARLDLDCIPLLPGTVELISHEVESTLAPGNRAAAAAIECDAALRGDPKYTALFDPQTSGGLIVGIGEAKVAQMLGELPDAKVIGEVVEPDDAGPQIVIQCETKGPATPAR